MIIWFCEQGAQSNQFQIELIAGNIGYPSSLIIIVAFQTDNLFPASLV